MKLELIGIEGLPEFEPGADVAALVADGTSRAGERLGRGDVVVITQKIVSKAEGRLVALRDVVPSPFASAWGAEHAQDPRLVELVLRESRRIVRMDRGLIIAETHHGFVCANAGVDISNVAGGEIAALLPRDPDASARRNATDPTGLSLKATVQAVADELAAACGLVARKLNRIPVVIARGLSYEAGDGSIREVLRAPERDLFR